MKIIANPIERFFSIPSVLKGKKSLIKAARQDVKNINHLLATISKETFRRLVDMIEKANRVFTFGIGISSIFSNLIAYTFNQIEKKAHSLDEGNTPVEEKIFYNTKKNSWLSNCSRLNSRSSTV